MLHALALAVLSLVPAAPQQATSTAPALRDELQRALDDWREHSKFAGATFGVVLKDGGTLALATGSSDRETKTAMKPEQLMLAGSVGKTFFGALALHLVAEKKLGLDDLVSKHLGTREWYHRLPNASSITVRMLMNHTSGLVRYEFDPKFVADLQEQPLRAFTPEEELAYLFDQPASFEAGKGWVYSDTNYIVLGLVIESITHEPCYTSIRRLFLEPFALARTVPSNTLEIAGLAQGYSGANDPLGSPARMLEGGKLVMNPQFEWAGGGFASNSLDLAHWAKALWSGGAIDAALLPEVLDGVAAPMLGADAKYGLCVIVRGTPLGPSFGHDGFFPGYMTQMRWFPEREIAAAVQVNTSSPNDLGRPLGRVLVELAEIAARE